MAEVGGATGGKASPPSHQRTKNEVQADKLGLTAAHLELIIKMPRDKLLHFAELRNFDEDQLNILRDIRRRGKNLIAAHNCRYRKLNEVEVENNTTLMKYFICFTISRNLINISRN